MTEGILDNVVSNLNEDNTKIEKLAEAKAITGSNNFTIPGYYRKTRPIVRKHKKVGRNDPCPCGSGKKYKNCCLSTGTFEETEES